ncbi:unnamed protein product, partial [Didymodactylos carnosus]
MYYPARPEGWIRVR